MTSWFRRDRKQAPAAVRGPLEIHQPWARQDLKSALRAGGFLTVTNQGAEPDRLVAASSAAAESIEIHAIKVVGAGIKMHPLAEGLVIPAENTVTLKPRGYHLLLQGLKAPLSAGSRLQAMLTFEKAGDIAIELLIEAPGPIGESALHEGR